MFKKEITKTVAVSDYDKVKDDLSLAENHIAKLNGRIDSLTDTIENLNGSIVDKEAEISKLKSQLSRIENSVNARVNEALVSLNVSSFARDTIYNSSADGSPEAILRKYNSLPANQRHEFYKKHKDVLTTATSSNIQSATT